MIVLLREVVDEPPNLSQLTAELQAQVACLGCTYRSRYRILSVVLEGEGAPSAELVAQVDQILAAHQPQPETDDE